MPVLPFSLLCLDDSTKVSNMAYSPPLSSTPMDLANNSANSYDFECVNLI